MYITPQTNIRLLHNVPFDSSYVHSLYFASASGQTAYFQNLTKYNLNNYSYQRYDKGVLRVQILADNLYDINYMMFQNRAFGNKWFYAFVDKVEYLNDATTAIYYHIDEIQTWMFDWNFAQCFVERMHTPTDEIGDNIIPEPLELGEYVYNNYTPVIKFRERAVMVAITKVNDDSEYVAEGDTYDGIYGACKLFAYSADATGVQGINAIITEYSAKAPDSVVSIYMIPKQFVPSSSINSGAQLPYGATGVSFTGETLDAVGNNIDGYTPKNKKLFTYPYNFQNITTGNGEALALRYEFFKDKVAKVNYFGNISQPVQLVCCPTDYKNVNKAGELGSYPNFVDEKITLTAYPLCSWNIDTWKAWVSQNAIPIIMKTAGIGASIALASYTPAVATEVASPILSSTGMAITKTETTPASITPNQNAGLYSLHNAENLLTTMYKASIAADQTKGNVASSNALYSNGEYTFHHGRMSVNRQMAEVIDSFFDRFGYAVNKVMTPSMHTRTNWTYIKTVDCAIHGSIPRDSEAIIENAFNNGITFWARPSVVTVGDYSQNNAPLT